MRERKANRVRANTCKRMFGVGYMVGTDLGFQHDDAGDIGCETQYRLWKAMTERPDIWQLYSPETDQALADRYTRSTAMNVAYDKIRKRYTERATTEALAVSYGVADDLPLRPGRGPKVAEYDTVIGQPSEEAIVRRELMLEAAEALKNPAQRRRMLYVLNDGLNFEQIAAIEGVSATAIRGTRDRALPHMVSWLNERMDTPLLE